jgi:hypothetical protein
MVLLLAWRPLDRSPPGVARLDSIESLLPTRKILIVASLLRGRRRPNRHRPLGARVEALESRRLLDGSWGSFAGNPQHTAISTVPSQSLGRIAWQTPVDLDPQYSGGDLSIHYGSPLVTATDTVIVPVKTGATGGFELRAFSGSDGTAEWTMATDYILPPHDWTPSDSPALTPGGRLYFAGAGGTVYYTDSPDSPGARISGQLAFYGISNYTHAGFDGSVYISTPITSDASGDIFFGFQVTGSNPLNLQSGIARIAADGTGRWVAATAASGDSGLVEVPQNGAPALSADGTTLYVAVSSGNDGRGDLLALDSTTLLTVGEVALKDPATGSNAVIADDSSASPTVGPDGDVYYGVLESRYPVNDNRGWLLHFSADLTRTKIPGAFGWDDTASIVPASMVPSYKGTSSYLVMTKYNDYAADGGSGLNKIAVLDPNASMTDPATGSSVMREVLTILGPTPDPQYDATHPGAVKEWCINTAAVDPATDSVLANSEDGILYRWDLANNTFSQRIMLTNGQGEAYTPTVIGADGTVYAINRAVLFAIKAGTSPTPTPTPSPTPPVLATIPDQTVGEGVQLNVQVTASDPDGDAIAFSLGPGAPSGAVIDPHSGLFTWTPAPGSVMGPLSITVVATDNGSPPLSAMTSFVVDVIDSGPAATITKARVSVKHGLSIALRFSQPLDPSTAANPGDFILVPAGKRKAPPLASIPLVVSYDPATLTVTLIARAKARRGQVLRLTVIGSGPDGIAKVTGLLLAGDGRHPGTNYVATIRGQSITHTNAAPSRPRSKAATNRVLSRDVPRASHAGRMAPMAHPTGPAAQASRLAAGRRPHPRP